MNEVQIVWILFGPVMLQPNLHTTGVDVFGGPGRTLVGTMKKKLSIPISIVV